MKKFTALLAVVCTIFLCFEVFSTVAFSQPGALCTAPDSSGTVALPASCPFTAPSGTMNIIDGLPSGTEIHSVPTIDNIINIVRTPNAGTGGETETFTATLTLVMTGTGDLSTFSRTIQVSIADIVEAAARTAGTSPQDIALDLQQMFGQVIGDPDFDLLRIVAGTGFGLPSPGHTTLTRKPSGDWNVDSFFDITYRIDFIGHPGGPLGGHSGSTTATIRMQQGGPPPPNACVSLDNGSGTANLPADCLYFAPSGTMDIINGLPPGDMLSSFPTLSNFSNITRTPGGTLGGEVEQFSADLTLVMKGNGSLGTYKRTFVIPHILEAHAARRTTGSPVQSFDTDMFRLQGQLPIGDPDFDLLRITAGTDFGMQSPGHVTVLKLHSGDWNVDSFFDITYRIDFVGKAGGRLGGMSGSTTGTIRMQQGQGALPSLPELLFGTSNYPPKGHYLSKPDTEVVYGGTPVRFKDIDLTKLSPQSPPPPLGSSQTYTVNGRMSLMVSTDNGASFSSTSVSTAASIRLTAAIDAGDTRYFDTEMLSLSLTGLPGGMMIRESPTLASIGKTTIRSASTGGYAIGSFFDIFTEISLNGGQSWTPSSRALITEISFPAIESPEITFATDDWPPPSGRFHTDPYVEDVVRFANGTALKIGVIKDLFPPGTPPPLDANGTVSVSGDGKIDFSANGIDFISHTVTINATISESHDCDDAADGRRLFETEMLQLNITSTTATAGFMLRESPTKQSLGRTTARNIGSSGQDGVAISSFFDVFTELSLDGGATWSPSTTPMRLQLDVPPRESPTLTVASVFLPHTGHLLSADDQPVAFGSVAAIGNPDLTHFNPQPEPPALGQVAVADLDGDGSLDFAVSGGSFGPMAVTMTATIEMRHSFDTDSAEYFDTEMLSMSLICATGTSTILLRESPTLASTGSVKKSKSNVSNNRISSFFDVFLELSMDGGGTWTAASRPIRIQFDVPPPVSPEMTFGSSNLPPRGHLTSERNVLVAYQNGAAISDFGLSHLSPLQAPPALGEYKDEDCDGYAEYKLQSGFIYATQPAHARIRVTHDYDKDSTEYFETEMLQLDITNSTGTAGVMLRESPSKASLGRTSVRNIGSSGQDGVSISSFFDIFTEISLDGGATWSSAITSMMSKITDRYLLGLKTYDAASDSLPPLAQLQSPSDGGVMFPNGVAIKFIRVELKRTSAPPALDQVSIGDLDGDGRLDLRVGGGNWSASSVTYTASLRFDHTNDGDTARFFDTEMLSMSLATVTGTSTILLRESPSKASLGRTAVYGHGTGGSYRIGSFFDIFTELSMDGGTTWLPADRSLPMEFGVPQVSTVCINKYFDANHNGQLDSGEEPMADVAFTLTGLDTTASGSTDVTGNLCFHIPPGDYTLTETVPAGYTPSNPATASINLTVASGQDTAVTWLNTAGQSDDKFRTASYMDWATAVDEKGALKPIKCKPYRVDFSVFVRAPKAATSMVVKFDMYTHYKLFSVTGQPTPVGESLDSVKSFTYTSAIDSGSLFRIDGRGYKGKKISVKVDWITPPKGKKITTKADASAFVYNQPGLPMPNLHNIGALLNGNIVVGDIGSVSRGGTKDTFKYVYHLKYSDVLKSLVTVIRGGLSHFHTGQARCLDFFDGTTPKPIIKPQKGLSPDKHNNSLFAELLTLKLNIASSDSGMFPTGLGELVYETDDDSTDMFNGMSIREIADAADSALSCYDLSAKNWLPSNFKLTLRNINGAFAGPVDTASWSCGKPVLKGVKLLKDVTFLRANPGVSRPFARKQQNILIAQPTVYALRQNYPNPFNPTTMIQFDLPEQAFVTMKIYNMLGQEVATLVNHEQMEDGIQEVNFNASSLASGVYFYRIVAEGLSETEDGSSQLTGKTFVSVKKMVLMK